MIIAGPIDNYHIEFEELKKEFYELELEKIGISYVQYQKEFQLIRDNLNNPNISEEEESHQDLISNLYGVSLKIKVLHFESEP